MDEILLEFREDIESIRQSIILLEILRKRKWIEEFGNISIQEHENMQALINQTNQCGTVFTKIEGSLILYVAGRFENYVRTLFEETCIKIAENKGSYQALHKNMKDNIVKFTAEIIANPRKYNHGEGGVITFVKNLYENIINDNVNEINYQCLSITSENMKSSTMQELFERIGIYKIWESISEQSALKTYFKSTDKDFTAKRAKNMLDLLMRLRNDIAHPSNGITWPDSNKIIEYISFLEVLSGVIKEVIIMHIASYESE